MTEKKIKKEVLIAFRVPQELFDLIQKAIENSKRKGKEDYVEYTVSSLVRKFIIEGLRRMNEDGRL